jgi:hypothetical protein
MLPDIPHLLPLAAVVEGTDNAGHVAGELIRDRGMERPGGRRSYTASVTCPAPARLAMGLEVGTLEARGGAGYLDRRPAWRKTERNMTATILIVLA